MTQPYQASAYRVRRGGSWYNEQERVRGAYRAYYNPRYRHSYDYGLRLSSHSPFAAHWGITGLGCGVRVAAGRRSMLRCALESVYDTLNMAIRKEETMTSVTFDQVLDLAHQLPRPQRANLIAHLSRDLAAELAVEHTRSAPAARDAWERLNQFRADIAALYPQADIGGRLEADRRERDAILTRHEESDVHP